MLDSVFADCSLEISSVSFSFSRLLFDRDENILVDAVPL